MTYASLVGWLPILAAVTFACVLALLAQLLWLGRRRGEGPGASAEEMRDHVLWGAFYVNPDDPRGWVPKVVGVGWTVNFRSRRAVVVFVTLLAVVLVGSTALSVAAVAGVD